MNKDYFMQFRTREERERDKCLNCGCELYDDDDPTPYERGYCRGCQTPPSSEKIDLIIQAWRDIGGMLGKVRKMKTLVVHPVFPPIPTTRYDYCAYIDGEEESGRYGYGPTPEAAKQDWLEQYGDEE